MSEDDKKLYEEVTKIFLADTVKRNKGNPKMMAREWHFGVGGKHDKSKKNPSYERKFLNALEPYIEQFKKAKNNQKRRNSQEVPEDVLAHIKYREGYGPRVYKDSLGYLTGGWGHLITPKDNMKLHDLIPPDVAENWLKQDSLKSYRAALEQAKELGKEGDADLVMILTSVNFQLGTYWRKKFPVS